MNQSTGDQRRQADGLHRFGQVMTVVLAVVVFLSASDFGKHIVRGIIGALLYLAIGLSIDRLAKRKRDAQRAAGPGNDDAL